MPRLPVAPMTFRLLRGLPGVGFHAGSFLQLVFLGSLFRQAWTTPRLLHRALEHGRHVDRVWSILQLQLGLDLPVS